jgi:hypothetical protein
VSRCIRHDDKLSALCDQAQEALPAYANLAGRCAVQSLFCHQDVLIVCEIGQVNGAGIDGQSIFDPVNNECQRVMQTGCGVDFSYDLSP